MYFQEKRDMGRQAMQKLSKEGFGARQKPLVGVL